MQEINILPSTCLLALRFNSRLWLFVLEVNGVGWLQTLFSVMGAGTIASLNASLIRLRTLLGANPTVSTLLSTGIAETWFSAVSASTVSVIWQVIWWINSLFFAHEYSQLLQNSLLAVVWLFNFLWEGKTFEISLSGLRWAKNWLTLNLRTISLDLGPTTPLSIAFLLF